LPIVTNQELELTSRIGKLCAGQDPGEVLCALLQNTIDALASLDAKTREEVEVQYIKTLVYMSANPGERFGPAKVFDLASRRQAPSTVKKPKR
jgi:hypothetical protein